jgi:hypothetical protein
VSNNAQLEALNTKLDKIISLLEPKKAEVEPKIEKVVTSKVKKTPIKK